MKSHERPGNPQPPGMQPASSQTQRPAARRRRTVVLWLALLGAAIGAGIWIVTRPDPLQLLKQGERTALTNPDEAERLIRRALAATRGRNPDARLALCAVLTRKGKWDEALSWAEGIDQTAARGDLLLDFGRLAFQAGHRDPGLKALQEVRRRSVPESAAALEVLMTDYQERQQQKELLDGARELTRLEPDNPARWAGLIGLLKAMFMDAECVAAIHAAMQRKIPDDFRHELRHQLVERLIVTGDATAAAHELELLEQSEGKSQRVRRKQIELYRLQGKLEEALDEIGTAFPDLERARDMYAARGAIYLDLARFDEATADLERAVTLRPFDEASQFKLGEAYRGLGRVDDAQKHRDLARNIRSKRIRINKLLRQLPQEPDNAELCRQLAELHRDLDEREPAEKWDRRAARLSARRDGR